MKETYDLDKISKIFNLPKSTLRYWENEGIISSVRNEKNGYREYSIEELVKICDIMFYRHMQVPLKQLKNLYGIPLEENIQHLYESRHAVDKKLQELMEIRQKIDKRLHSYEKYQILSQGNIAEGEPFFSKITQMDLTSGMNIENYLNDQGVLALCLDLNEKEVNVFGTHLSNDEHEIILWEKTGEWKYYPCLLEIVLPQIKWESIQSAVEQLKKEKYTIGHVIATFLVTDQEVDYYQAWIEYK